MSTAIKITFSSARGDALSGVIDTPASPAIAYALFAHCFSCSKDLRAARELARTLVDAGIAVMRFDFAGLGESGGDFSDTNFSSSVDDLVSAADYLRGAYVAPELLIGHSLGGAAVIVAAARIAEARVVAVIGAPADASHVAHQFGDKRGEIAATGSADVSLAGRSFVIKRQFLDDIETANVLAAASALRRPLLILHSARDATVGVDNAARLFAAARHPKSFVSLDNADHLLSNPQDARYAARVLAAWASRYIGEADATSGAKAAPSREATL